LAKSDIETSGVLVMSSTLCEFCQSVMAVIK